MFFLVVLYSCEITCAIDLWELPTGTTGYGSARRGQGKTIFHICCSPKNKCRIMLEKF